MVLFSVKNANLRLCWYTFSQKNDKSERNELKKFKKYLTRRPESSKIALYKKVAAPNGSLTARGIPPDCRWDGAVDDLGGDSYRRGFASEGAFRALRPPRGGRAKE